ncbi:hypothetical protein ACIBBD_28195 [Streptomyces sp. NPDC051315]|uniref:hypothetical protein n=1 Tax=Streptomyces sp. NPDC051315 TaxID=3365650 RepID=UPI003791E050
MSWPQRKSSTRMLSNFTSRTRFAVADHECDGALVGHLRLAVVEDVDVTHPGSGEQLKRAGRDIQRGFGDYVGAALMWELVAWITAARDDHEGAVRLLGAVRTLWRRRQRGVRLPSRRAARTVRMIRGQRPMAIVAG